MTCQEARESFSALVDDALPHDERAGLEAHLHGCAECRKELARFRATVGLLGRLEAVRAPVGFVDQVVSQAFPVPWSRRLLAWLFLPLRRKVPLEAAAIVLVSLSAVYVLQRTPEVERAAFRDLGRPEATAPSTTASSPPEAPATVPGSPPPRPVPGRVSPSERATIRATRPPAGARQEPGNVAQRESRESPDQERTPRDREILAKEASPAVPVPPRSGATGLPGEVAPSLEAKKAETDASQGSAPPAGALSGPGAVASGTMPPAGPSPAAPAPPRAAGSAVAPGVPASPPSPAAGLPGPSPAAAPDVPAKRESSKDSRPGALEERAKAAAPRATTRLLVAPDVEGRLRVAAREPAEAALDALAARLGATRLARRADAADLRTVVVELVVARAAYPDLVAGLAAIGAWAPEREPPTLPREVRVEIAITD